MVKRRALAFIVLACVVVAPALAQFVPGREVALRRHLQDGEEFEVSTQELIEHGRQVFNAMWTVQEGGGRPLTTGTGKDLRDPGQPLTFPRNFNRLSAPDANSCGGCHNLPRSGGGGDVVTNVFVLAQRFDHITFDPDDLASLVGSHDENGIFATLPEIANNRATLGMFGSGYIEMLARQITRELRAIVAETLPGETRALTTTGVSFGSITRLPDGSWDTSAVEGLPPSSVASDGPDDPPDMVLKPFHQAGAVVSLREFSNNAYNHHHGMQSSERFGLGMDPDGDGFVDELTRADITAVTIYQATLAVPGRVIPRFRPLEDAVLVGEARFEEIGCATCHIPALPLGMYANVFHEPNPFNPAGNLQAGEVPFLKVDLNDSRLPQPRLRRDGDVTWVPAYTDFKLHDITSGPNDPNREELDMQVPGTPGFFDGNSRFLTKKLWGAGNEPPFFHHGKFVTLREAILAHAGEAQASTDAFHALTDYEQGSIVEFLKTLQVLDPGTRSLVVDGRGNPRRWPPAGASGSGP